MSATGLGAVLTGKRSWAVVCANCLDVIPTIPPELRPIVAGDPPYGTKKYRSDRDVTVQMLRAAEGWTTLALKGYAPKLYRWLHAIGIEEPEEWIAWAPSNCEAKGGGRGTHLPHYHEDIAVCGYVPGAHRLTRERRHCNINRDIQRLHRCHSKEYDPTQPARMGDVWTDPSPGIAFQAHLRKHPNETALGVQLKLVELISDPGDLILDPFAGSGSLGVAAIRLGRRYVGIEINEEWASLARDNITAEQEGSTLEARRAGQLSLLGGAR
jgi:site-specific DNA-methyltransferase (adenine-specific)